jgi:2-iminobutanoate/2-iminopropanoate deaminase
MSNAVGPYSPVLKAGDWVILSGQLGIVDGKLVDGGVDAQTRQIFTNAAGLLAKAGTSLASVAKCTVFLTDMADFPTMNAAYVASIEAAAPGHRPTRSTVGNVTMALGALVEIEFWAYVGAGGVMVP